MAGTRPPVSTRTGWGFDAHRLGGEPPLLLAGVIVSATEGVIATSDGDVAAHALTDAVLGAAALGDMGEHFPSHDPAFAGADSLELLARAVNQAAEDGWSVEHADVTVVAESIRVAPHREAMRAKLSTVLGIDEAQISVKATTTDGLGAIGSGEGIAAVAVVTLVGVG